MATYGRFVRVVTAISRRDLVDAGRVQLLTNSTSLFALYGHDGATAGYARILPVLRCALQCACAALVWGRACAAPKT